MKILTFTTLFPNAEKPNDGIFVESRLRHLIASGKVESRVVAPIPWFPFTHHKFGRYATFAKIPASDTRAGIKVTHPRYPLIPKVGMTLAPLLMASAVKPAIKRVIEEGYEFDLIDAHYFYPDGVAAVLLGRYFNKPVVITARGTDINLIPQHRLPRKMILWAAKHANGLITVCNALKKEMVHIGVEANRITPLRNGVDLQRFHPIDRAQARDRLRLKQFTLLTVGHLVPRKGNELVIGALPDMPDVRLLVAGSGPERKRLELQAQSLNVANRVTFVGPVSQADLKFYYGAADALVLASSREGWANVLLESMACGTPVVASNVWGTPEVVASPDAGVLMTERTSKAIAAAVQRLRANYPNHEATRKYAEGFSWDDTTNGQLQIFNAVLQERKP